MSALDDIMLSQPASSVQSSALDDIMRSVPTKEGDSVKNVQPPSSFLAGFGRGAASLADTFLGVPSAVASLGTYAANRAFHVSPSEASDRANSVASAISSPVGKAFGVTETPEYKTEASKQLLEWPGIHLVSGSLCSYLTTNISVAI